MELDTADHRRSSGVTSGLHRMLTLLLGPVRAIGALSVEVLGG